jgi:DNA-binding transcriptional LysR family regulator
MVCMSAPRDAHPGIDVSKLGLETLRWFVLAAEAGSLGLAARRAGVAQSTVSRALARLEATVGVEIARRSGRAFRLTEAGELLLPLAREVLGDVERLARAAGEARGEVGGTVRLSLCTSLGRHVILPALIGWRAERPQAALDIRFEERDLDPRTAGVDLVVRAGRPKDSDVHSTSLGDYGHVLVAAPGYLARRGSPAHPSALREHDTVAMRLDRPWTTWPFRDGTESVSVSVLPAVTVTDADALRDLACAGQGLTVLPDYLAAPALRSGELVRVLDAWTLPRIPVFAFHAPRRKLPRVVAEVLDTARRAVSPRAPG